MKKVIVGSGIAIAAAALFFASMADYAFPGEGARLMVLWAGLDNAPFTIHPVMAFFQRMLTGNVLAPICGVLSVIAFAYAVYALTKARTLDNLDLELEAKDHLPSRIAGIASILAVVLFAITPCVRSASTHLNTEIFDATLVLLALAFSLTIAVTQLPAWLMALASGLVAGLALADTLSTMPGVVLVVASLCYALRRRKGRTGMGLSLAVMMGGLVFLLVTPLLSGSLGEVVVVGLRELKLLFTRTGSGLVILVTIVPFVIVLGAASRMLVKTESSASLLSHVAIAFAALLAVATSLAPGDLLARSAYLPVMSSAFAAFLGSYSSVYWAVRIRRGVGFGRVAALVIAPTLVVVAVVTAAISLFQFDGQRGAFADRVADRIIADLGNRTWFVTDGTLDDHLRLAAARAGKELQLVCLQRDDDELYLATLREAVKAKNLGGPKNAELLVSLSLGVYPFVQDWFRSDPTIGDQVAVFGAPDLFHSTGVTPVPEFLFFGADPGRGVHTYDSWNEFSIVLEAPKGWGSHRLAYVQDSLERMRLLLRRHVGLVANNRGVWWQDQRQDAAAWKCYELVRREIDRDNVCALFNEYEMLLKGYVEAAKIKGELERLLRELVADKSRHVQFWRLSSCYGYIRSPEIFLKLGLAWVRSGMYGAAITHVTRAIDFVPDEGRVTLLNMMAALYAGSSDAGRSRKTYETVLAREPDNSYALIGLFRLEMLEGNLDQAEQYYRQVVKAGKGDIVRCDYASLRLMRGDSDGAKRLFKEITDADPTDSRAWALYAAAVMREHDLAKTPAEKAKALKELQHNILPAMEKHLADSHDYHLQTTKAFLLLRLGNDRRQEARDMFAAASKARPDVTATQDIVLDLDIQLNDTADAARQAREMLRRNRKAPYANYVMGSLAMRKGDELAAETFLRFAANAERPVPYAQNDLAEMLRRRKDFSEAERYARMAVRNAPELYVAWDTLAAVLLDEQRDLDEAESCSQKACELSKGVSGVVADPRMLITLARVQVARGMKLKALSTIGKVRSQIDKLNEFERKEFEDFAGSIR